MSVAARVRIAGRYRPSPVSLNGPTSLKSLTLGASHNPAFPWRRHVAVGPLLKWRDCSEDAASASNQHHRLHLRKRDQFFGLHRARSPLCARGSATTSSAASTVDGDRSSAVDVAQSRAGNGDGDDRSGEPPSGSTDREVEEDILSLQTEVRTHHRHAAYGAALDAAARLLERTTSHFGHLHPATASAHNNVGLMNKLLGNYGEAKEAYHEALRVYGEVCGKDHASYAAALSNLGMLERGRVLESEAEDGEEAQEDGASGGGVHDEGAEMQQSRSRDSHTAPTSAESKLSAMERMQLNESAIEYFDEAHRIRLTELGPHHPHTVASRSQLGSAMAAAVIAERKGRIGGLVEAELRKVKQQKNVTDVKEMEAHVPGAIARAAAAVGSRSKLTQRRWDVAEEHLREALTAAVENPRGESVSALEFIPIGSAASPSVDTGGGNAKLAGRLTLPLEKNDRLSKKDRRRMEKKCMREKRKANFNALQSGSVGVGSANPRGKNIAVQGAAAKVTTLSAATAAQNLAVFLKHYSDWLRLSLVEEDHKNVPLEWRRRVSTLNQTVQESRHLYEAALHVRTSILPSHHPEVVASKYSLAELLDSPIVVGTSPTAAAVAGGEGGVEEMVDGERARGLRDEILNAYNVEEREEEAVRK